MQRRLRARLYRATSKELDHVYYGGPLLQSQISREFAPADDLFDGGFYAHYKLIMFPRGMPCTRNLTFQVVVSDDQFFQLAQL